MGKSQGKRRLYALVKVNWKALAGAVLCAGLVFAAVFTVSAATAEEGAEIPVVMYHSVLKDEARHGKYVIAPEEFESDLDYLEKHGYTTILISDLIAYTKGGELPEKPILLTFDDGYYNNYLYAFEIAKKHNVKFVISPIGYFADFYTESGERNAYYTHATWDELREMADSGLVEVQNHSYDLHKNANGRTGVKKASGETEAQYEQRLTEDLLRAQNAIEEHVGARPTTMVYPFGAVSKATPGIVKKLGFSATLTCEERTSRVTRDPESLYGLGRYLRVSGVTSREFFEKKMKLKESEKP